MTATVRRKAPVAAFRAPEIPTALRAPTIPDSAVRRARHKAAAAEVKASQTVLPETKHSRPSSHNGVAIEREERIAIGPHGSGKIKISKLYLADGSMAYACWDCTATGNGRGDIIVHRNRVHGTKMGGNRNARVALPKQTQEELFDVILPRRADGSAPPETATDWTLGEFLAIAPNLKALGDLIDRVERENNELREQLKQTRVNRTDQHKIDVYESNQQEIGELRAWKKNVTKKLSTVGFVLSDEEEQ